MNGALSSCLEQLAHEVAGQWGLEISAPFALSNHLRGAGGPRCGAEDPIAR